MGRLLSAIRRHPWRTLSVALLVLVAGVAVANRDLIRLAVTPEEEIDTALPVVASLDARDGEVVYRIDPERSQVVVGVDEILAGDENRVELTTNAIAGELAVTAGSPPGVRIGEVAVDVRHLRSDNALRDKALRHDYLESHTHPQVRLRAATVELPDDATAQGAQGATITGELEVRGEPHEVTWDVDARVDGETMSATATTTLLMSDLGIGPINKVGLVRTSDEVDLELRIVAVDARRFEAPEGLVAEEVASTGDAADAPSFASDVAPILEQNCVSCHRRGSVGASMQELDTAGDAAEVADGLAVVTRAGYMPPWPASDVGVELRHDRSLSDEQIRTISEWADAGGPLDVDEDTPLRVPEEDEPRTVRADRVVTMDEPYTADTEQRDDYRCFILDPGITEPSFITGYTFDPDRLEILHHVIVFRVRAGEPLERARATDAADEGPGWSCQTGMNSGGGDRIAGWVPGQQAVTFAEDEGFDMQPGDMLVAQIHYHVEYDPPADRSGMTLQLAPDPSKVVPLRSTALVGPVELPCPDGATSPLCDRDAAVADLGERFGPATMAVPDVLHRGCGTTPEEVAALSDGWTATTTCDFDVRLPGQIVGLLGHMHEIGASYRMTLNPDTPEETVLLDIPTWNFGWQLGYRPVEDILLERGDTIRVTCTWDRRLRHDPDPRYIVFADGTEDEMCFSTVTVRPPDEPVG